MGHLWKLKDLIFVMEVIKDDFPGICVFELRFRPKVIGWWNMDMTFELLLEYL